MTNFVQVLMPFALNQMELSRQCTAKLLSEIEKINQLAVASTEHILSEELKLLSAMGGTTDLQERTALQTKFLAGMTALSMGCQQEMKQAIERIQSEMLEAGRRTIAQNVQSAQQMPSFLAEGMSVAPAVHPMEQALNVWASGFQQASKAATQEMSAKQTHAGGRTHH